ncbi:adenylosuccinate lyase [Carboxydothermus hydrogenoformans]|uniref:Adenylosuccinate lyase n=1 Tax=Carboxydothermus hydrogenoformans (strain ATCC BAA-161 / DSM 6008 / Z-2901) TaxID=246194 RepID=Q3AD68_CARHZ|nr:adenylosuccinate lyase [Carboxydothermus hydrogenoformans]ABB14901.1 adenylosuccinate lyase [Carboxydothermus hydrogenoformans Z-2901]
MIARYTLPEMKKLWSDETKYQNWLKVEIAVAEAMGELGLIPLEAAKVIKEKANFDVDRILEIEKTVKHDVIAFLTNVAEYVGEESKYIHKGLTSSDVLDTALALQLKEAGELLLRKLEGIYQRLLELANKHRYTVMIGRTHGVHAEPITFGLKMLLWAAEIERDMERLKTAIKTVSVGKISGAVGTYANVPPEVEKRVCEKLGLTPEKVSTQIIQRDRHAEFVLTLALIATTFDKFATEIRTLQRTEILELEEPFTEGQKGSSAMPHKRNPVLCERISGLARVVRSYVVAALENVVLWQERDISHSSAERMILPDATSTLYYMMHVFREVIDNLNIYPERMERNLNLTGGLIFSQRVLLALVEKGILRETAYKIVQRNAMTAWKTGKSFKELLLSDEELTKLLTLEEIAELFDYNYHLKYVDEIFKRFGL